jgi:hypothetical protein
MMTDILQREHPQLSHSAGSRHAVAWRVGAGVEVVLAIAAVAVDLFLPALVISLLALLSLLVRRSGPGSLGLHRVRHLGRIALQTFGLAVALTLFNFAVSKPVLEHVSGERQDMSAFEDLQGNVTMLIALLALSWTLAAFAEEFAFRGFLLTRLTEVVGTTAFTLPVAVLVSAVVFGFLHTEYGLIGVAVSTVDAIFYTAVRYHYRTLWAGILTHGFVDTIGMVSVFLVGPIYALW